MIVHFAFSLFSVICVSATSHISFGRPAFLDVLAYPIHSKNYLVGVLCSNCLIYSCCNYARQKNAVIFLINACIFHPL